MKQITIEEYIRSRRSALTGCHECICKKCLYWWSGRCSKGGCYDDFRAKDDPYDKAHPHPGLQPRKLWSNWNKPGEQAHWCRGGIFYPANYCESFVKYEGTTVEECVRAAIEVFQDGHIRCSIKDHIGCEACTADEKIENIYNCQHMTDSGCNKLIEAKNRMLDAIASGEQIEPCSEQCCMGCHRNCKYRCGVK